MTSSTKQVPRIRLRGDVEIPQLGFGVWQIPDDETAIVTEEALKLGYRHVDTAAAYYNEAGVGAGIRASGVPRSEIFITTKLANRDHGYEQAIRACRDSLEKLEIEHLDLYLIHWPTPMRGRFVETWQALIELQRLGLARAIGVSNFTAEHVDRIVEETGVTPAVDQVELHPYLQQRGLRRELERLDVVVESWSPLAQGAVINDAVVRAIGDEHRKSAAQVTIRWHLQHGFVVFPKSVTPERLAQNLEVFDFELSAEEMARIDELDGDNRLGGHPDTFDHQPIQ